MKYLMILLITLFGYQISQGAEKQFKIRIAVNAGDKDLQNRAESYFSRAFRSLNDIENVETNELFYIDILIDPIKVQDKEIYYHLTIYCFENCELSLKDILKMDMPENVRHQIPRAFTGAYIIWHRTTMLTGTQKIQLACEEAVTDLDVNVFSPLRKRILNAETINATNVYKITNTPSKATF